MFFTIYKTTNLLNNMIYVGCHYTFDPWDSYLGSGLYLRNAINKHGIENFKKEVLFMFGNEQEMLGKEAEIVNEEFLKRDDVYNLCHGGWIPPSKLGVPDKQETKIKKQIAAKNRPPKSERHKINIGLAQIGRIHSIEHIEKRMQYIRGSILSEEHKNKISASSKGKRRITNGINNMWLKNGDSMPFNYRFGMTRRKKCLNVLCDSMETVI